MRNPTTNCSYPSNHRVIKPSDKAIAHLKVRHYVEFVLIRLWVKNADKLGLFSFEPVNIGTEKNVCLIDGIKYDLSVRTIESAEILTSTGTDDKLLLRMNIKKQQTFIEAPIIRTYELKRLVNELNKKYSL